MLREKKIILLLLLGLGILLLSSCVRTKIITESEAIPYETVKEEDPALFKGTTQIKQEGIQGIKTVTYEERYSGGRLSRKKIKEEVVYKPVDQIIKIGTRQALVFNLNNALGSYELTILAAKRLEEGFTYGRSRVRGDSIVITGTLKKLDQNKSSPGRIADLALINPSFGGKLIFLPLNAPEVKPGEVQSVLWFGSLNSGKVGRNNAIGGVGEISVIPRAFIGPKNQITGESKSLAGLPEE